MGRSQTRVCKETRLSAIAEDQLNPPGSRFRAQPVVDEDFPDKDLGWEVWDDKHCQAGDVPNGARATAETQAYERNAKEGWDA